MQINNRQGLVSEFIPGVMFLVMRVYILLVLLGGTLTLLVISRLFRNIGRVLVTLIIALIIYIYFKQ